MLQMSGSCLHISHISSQAAGPISDLCNIPYLVCKFYGAKAPHLCSYPAKKCEHLKLYIKYMVSTRCKMAVKVVLREMGLHFIVVDLGEVEIMEDLTSGQQDVLKTGLLLIGLELMEDKKAILIEKIQSTITEMIHGTDEAPKANYSDFISEKLGYDYTYLSNIFSEVKGITIQQFIIIHKVERIKELIIYDELNISEIAWKMNYSSVAHLSNQFKKITGLSPSHFRQLKTKRRSPIDAIGNPNNEMLNQE
jgi:AraC-like DNA-binding protein